MSAVRKSQRQRLEELRQALVVIENGLRTSEQTGDEAHFLPVIGQLRALLVSSGQTPLLLDLAKELRFPLEFYSIQPDYLDNEQIAEILGPKRIQWTGDSLAAEPVPPIIRQRVTMEKWLSSTQVVVNEKKISGEELVKMVANKLGGAHYDPKLPPELAAMALFNLGGVTSFYRTLVCLADVVVQLGRKLLEQAQAQRGSSAADEK